MHVDVFGSCMNAWFLASEMDPMLSPFRVKNAGILRSVIACLIYAICLAASKRVMYSDSVVEMADDRCFLAVQETRQSLIRKHCPKKERLSLMLEA